MRHRSDSAFETSGNDGKGHRRPFTSGPERYNDENTLLLAIAEAPWGPRAQLLAEDEA